MKNHKFLFSKFSGLSTLASLSIITLSVTACLSLSGCLGAVFAGGAVAANAAGNSLTIGTQVDDVTIKTKAVNVLNKYPELVNNSNVEITVFNHIVLILGQVPSQALSDNIANDISQISNVRMVYNRLTVGKPVSFGTYAHDSWLTTKVKAALVGKVNPAEFTVITENGVVYLIGLVTQADGNVAALAASKVSGVDQVVRAYVLLPNAPLPPAPVTSSS
jgi:osmotically-inducible protein OsmY